MAAIQTKLSRLLKDDASQSRSSVADLIFCSTAEGFKAPSASTEPMQPAILSSAQVLPDKFRLGQDEASYYKHLKSKYSKPQQVKKQELEVPMRPPLA